MMACIDQFYEAMMARSEEMKQMQGYKTGENYAYLGLSPHFLVFDEYVAFMEMLASKESTAVLTKLKHIAMLPSSWILSYSCLSASGQMQNI